MQTFGGAKNMLIPTSTMFTDGLYQHPRVSMIRGPDGTE